MPSLEQIANGAKASGLTQKDFEARILANPRYSGVTREEIAAAWNSGLKKKDQSSGLNGPGTKTGSTASRSLSGIRERSTQPTSVSDAAPSLSRQQGLSDLSKQKPASASKAEGLYGIKRNEVYQNAALQVIQENIDNGYITADEVASLSQTPDKIFESIAERKTEESQKLRPKSPEEEIIEAQRQSYLKRGGATLNLGGKEIDPFSNQFKYKEQTQKIDELNSRLQDLTKQEIISKLPEDKRNDREFLKEIEKDLFLTQGIGLDLSGDKRFNDQNVLKDIAVSFGAGIQSIDYGIRSAVGSGTDMFGLPLEAGNILAKQGIKYNSTQFEKDVLDSLNDGDFENAARITLNVTANSLPIMAAGAAAFSAGAGLGAASALARGVTGAAVTAAANTAGTVASYATLATLSAAQTYGDVKDEEWFKEMSDIEALGYVSAMGGTEAVGEFFGGKVLTRAMRGIVAAGGEEAAKKTFTEYIKGIAKAGGVNLYENTLGEAFTGASQYVVENFAKGEEITANGIIDAAKRSGVSGLGMAGAITTAGASVSVPLYLGSKIGREFKVLKLNKQIEKKRDAILKAETPDERYALAKDVLALTKERDGAVKSSVDFFDKMSKDDQAKVYALTTELQETAKVRLESRDEEARDSMQKQIFSAYSQVKEIIKKYENDSQEGVDEIMSLPDDQVISFNVESLDQIPEQFRDRAEKKNDFEFKVRETIFGLPIGKETTKVVNQGYSYTLTGKEAKDYAVQNKTVDTKYDSQEGQQVPGTQQTGEAPIQAQPVEGAGAEAAPAGRVVQGPKQEVGTVRSLINRRATYSDPVSGTIVEGDVYQDGQRVVLETAEGKIFDIGNVEEMQDKSPREFGLMEAQERISVNDDGSFVYNGGDNQKIPGGTVMVNRRSGLKSIKRGKDGSIKSVTLTSPDGTQTYNLTGQDAVDAAYQIVLNFSTSPAQAARVEQLLNENEQARTEIQQAARTAREVVTLEPITVATTQEATTDTVGPSVGGDGTGVTDNESKAPVGKVASSEEVASRVASSPSKSRMYTAVKRAISSLKKLFPDAEYVFVDSDAEALEYYKQNMKKFSDKEDGTDKGKIIENKNSGKIEIVINTSRADATTVYHELFHAAFYKAYAQDAATAIDFANRLSKVLNSGTAAEKAIAKRIDQHIANYQGETEGVISEEFLSELAGILAADAKSITQGMAAKIANFINNIAKAMKIDRPIFTEAATTKEVVDFMNSFAAAAREGGNVTEKAAKTGALRTASSKSVQQKANTVDGIREKVGKLPTIMTEAMAFADAASMNNKIEFKRALQEKFKKNLPELRKKYKITDGSVMDDNLKKYLVDAYIYETLVAIDAYPDALGWYDSKTRKAMEIMSLIHPELKTDPISESAFKIVLAITSNGNKVKQNFDEADRQYRYWKDNGRFDSETSIGTQSAGIKSTLRLVNAVLDRISMPEFYSFLNSKFKAGDLTYLNSSGKKTKLLSGYLTKDIVFGASVFGPKIGNGFFMNLNGEFGQLTMDRWFMRQYGRLTGTLLTDEITAKKKISNNILNVKESVNALTKEEKAVLNSLIPGALKKNIKDLAIAVAKISIKRDSRDKISVGNLNQLRKDANTLDKNLKGEIEAPQGGTQRKFIVDIFNEVQEKLKNEFGIDITIADLQAVNWYPEKSLYKAFKKGKDSVKSKDLTSIDEQPDYESAAVSLAKENGITQSEIDDATRRITGDGATGESIGESVKQGIDKFGGFDQAVIEDLSRKILDVKSEMTGGLDEQTEVPKKAPRGKKSKTNAIIDATPSEDGRLPVTRAVEELDNFSPRSSKLDNSKKGFSDDELIYLRESIRSKTFIEKLINNETYAFLTAENPDNVQASKEENAKYMEDARQWLIDKGYEINLIYGMYDNKENSFFVPYMTFEDAALFREKFRQESVAHSDALINGKSQDRVAKEMFKKDYESLKKKEKAKVDAGVAKSKYCNPRIKGQNSFDVDYKNPENNYYSVFRPPYETPFGVSTSYDFGSEFSLAKGLKNSKSREDLVIDVLEKSGGYGLNDDGKGNFVFYHYGDIKGPAIKGSFFGKNKYTSDKRYWKPVSMYYTRRGESEPMVNTSGKKPHVVLIPKNKVYPLNADPMAFYERAKKRYVLSLYPSGKLYHLTVENDLHKFDFPVGAQAAFIGELAKENGYLMIVSSWNSMGLSTRGESQTDLEYDVEATNTYRETREARIYPDKDLIDIPPTDFQSRSSRSSEASDVARQVADQYYKKRGKVDLSLMQRLTGVIYRWFVYTPEQMEILRMKETRESMIGRKMDESEKLAIKLYELIKKDVEAAALVEEYMSGPTAENIDAIEKLKNGAKILDAANEMRAFIDNMSSQLVNGPAFSTLNQELKEAVLRNIGSYLKTSYRFWKDKKFKITDAAIKNAAAHVYDVIRAKKIGLLMKEGKSQLEVEQFLETTKEQMFNEALQQINDYVRQIEKIRSAPKYKGSGMVTTGQVKIPGESFQKRKDIPSFIQELLGVEKDPHIRFLDTAEALINILYKGEMAAKLVNAFGNDVLISDDVITKEDKESGEYKQVKDEYSPLNRMWVPIDFFDVINNTDIYSSDNTFLQVYFNILRISRMTKVIPNPSNWRKNLTGGWQALMANGIINPKFIKDLANRPGFTVAGIETEEITQLLDEMAQYGIGGGGVGAKLVGGVDAIYSGIIRNDYNSVDKALNYINNIVAKASKRYGAVDDYTKMVAYRDRRISFAKKLYGANYETLSEYQQESVRAAAAEEVKQTFPTFSRLPPFFRGVAKLPFGDFLPFPLESIRSLVMIGATARTDINKAKDPKLSTAQRAEYAKTGVAKLLGTATALALPYVIPGMIESALGFDDDDEIKDIKLLRPEWMSGDNLILVKADKNGNVNVYNATTEDAYGPISSMVVHLNRGELGEVANALADAVGFNMTVNMFMNLSRNEDQYGRPLFESYDSFAKKSLKVIGYITKETVSSPWLYSSGRDAIYLAKERESNVFNEFGELAAERAVIRDYQYNVGQQFYFKAIKGAEGIKKDEQYTTLTGGDRERRLMAISKLKREYEALLRYSARYNNYEMANSAKSVIKKYYGKDEERYILYGQLN